MLLLLLLLSLPLFSPLLLSEILSLRLSLIQAEKESTAFCDWAQASMQKNTLWFFTGMGQRVTVALSFFGKIHAPEQNCRSSLRNVPATSLHQAAAVVDCTYHPGGFATSELYPQPRGVEGRSGRPDFCPSTEPPFVPLSF